MRLPLSECVRFTAEGDHEHFETGYVVGVQVIDAGSQKATDPYTVMCSQDNHPLGKEFAKDEGSGLRVQLREMLGFLSHIERKTQGRNRNRGRGKRCLPQRERPQ